MPLRDARTGRFTSAGIHLDGVKQIQRKLAYAAKQKDGGIAKEIARALYQETNVELVEVKKQTPVDTAALINSEFVDGPHIKGRNIFCNIYAGGPAAPYAMHVHEDLDAHHPKGKAKYIEDPINESAPYMPGRVAKRMDLNRIFP